MAFGENTFSASGMNYHYLFFDGVTRFNRFVDKRALGLSEHNLEVWKAYREEAKESIEEGTDWYGTPPPASLDDLENHRKFMGMNLLRKIRPKVRRFLDKFLSQVSEELMPIPQISYNEMGLGLFSFDRAMMGMYRMSEMNTSTRVDTLITQLDIALGRDGLKTRTKDVYAWEEHSDVSYPALRLYLLAGANADIQGDEMLYVGLACSELVEFMDLRGIPIEVNVLIGTSFNGSVYMAVVRIKRFEDGLNTNQLLLMTSDPRYFRYKGFKSLICLADHFGQSIPSGLGAITKSMAKEFVKSSAPDGVVFEQSYSLDKAASEVEQIIKDYHKKLNNEENTSENGDHRQDDEQGS